MSDFLKKFLLEDPRRLGPAGRFVGLAAFGKHPGWDDHIEDLGLETESLNFAKLMLYVNGIGGQIDSGAWEKLDSVQQLPGFKHLFVWQRSGQILIGRMWSSSDGKGRKRYPMVVCLHWAGVTLAWALKQGLPVLAELEQGCIATTSAEEVRSLLARKRAQLRDAIQSADSRGEYAPVSPESLNTVLNPGNSEASEGFLRVLYQMESQLGGFAPGTRATPASIRVQQIRVPVVGATPELTLLFWSRFFLVFVDPSIPLLITFPLEANWVDVTAGEPESHEFFCLRATPKAVPLVSEVPYKLEQDFRAKALAFLDAFRRGETRLPDLKSASNSVPAPAVPAKGGWLKWLGVGCFVLVAAAAGFVLMHKNAGPDSSTIAKKDHASDPVASSPASAPSNVPTATATAPAAPADDPAEAARLAQEKKKTDALAAAERLKAETEAAAQEQQKQLALAAAKEKERLRAEAAAQEKQRQLDEAAAKEKERVAAEAARLEAARLETERMAALQKQIEQQKSQAAVPVTQPANVELVAAKTTATPATQAPAVPAPGSDSTSTASQMTNSIGMVLIALPSGLWVGKYEVTQAEYSQVMQTNPSNPRWLNARQPVEQVTWNDAVEFTRRLTERERASLPSGKSYSLPTEKQWLEFSAGQKFEDLPGATAIRKDPAPVGQSGPANKLGLYDVLGNLWEWCLDDAPGDQKLLKGGAFNSNNYDRTLRPDAKSLSCGFRCVLGPSESR